MQHMHSHNTDLGADPLDLLGLDLFLVMLPLLKSHFMLWVRQKIQSCPNTMFCILQILFHLLCSHPEAFYSKLWMVPLSAYLVFGTFDLSFEKWNIRYRSLF